MRRAGSPNLSSSDMRLAIVILIHTSVCTESAGWQLFSAPGARVTLGKAGKVIHRNGDLFVCIAVT